MKNFIPLFLLVLGNSAFALSINQIYDYLKTVNQGEYAKYEDITYSAPTINILRDDQEWLLQTPNLWGHNLLEYLASKKLTSCSADSECGPLAKCKTANFTLTNSSLCLLPEHTILNNLANNITNAKYTIDIAQLGKSSGITNGEFTDTIKNSLYKLAKKSVTYDSVVEVRILSGSLFPVFQKKNLHAYLENLISDFPPDNKLRISVANIFSCLPGHCDNGDLLLDISTNHAKFINIDNQDVITGGENYWGENYFGDNPVNDSNIEIAGPIAQSATTYANTLWDYVNAHKGKMQNYCFTYEDNKINNNCLTRMSTINSNKINYYQGTQVAALPVMKLNNGVLAKNADQSEIARVYAFKNAINSIKISQQAIFTKGISPFTVYSPINSIDGNVIDALAYALYNNDVEVSIVISNKHGEIDVPYTSFVDLDYVWKRIRESIFLQFPDAKKTQVQNKLLRLLNLANIDFDHSNNKNINNHNKFWMVDDHIFYFGSHNIYLTPLQEYGIIIDSLPAAEIINSNFWKPMWENANPGVFDKRSL